jgi:hypothetical protein
MSEVKIVLKRSPKDPENGVWIDGNRIPDVKDVTVYGTATDIAQVVITMMPKKIIIGLDSPDMDVVSDEPKN